VPWTVAAATVRAARRRPPSHPALYATEPTPLDEKVLHLHYFGGAATGTSPSRPGDGHRLRVRRPQRRREWGTFDLWEVATTLLSAAFANGVRFPFAVERDCHFTRGPLSRVR
jgi:hypothetical protein